MVSPLNLVFASSAKNEKGKVIEKTAVEHYERMNRGVGSKDTREATVLLHVRGAINAKYAGHPDPTLKVCECSWASINCTWMACSIASHAPFAI